MEVQAAGLGAWPAGAEIVANQMGRPRERRVEREDLEGIGGRTIGKRRYHRPTVAGVGAHDARSAWIVEATQARFDPLVRRKASALAAVTVASERASATRKSASLLFLSSFPAERRWKPIMRSAEAPYNPGPSRSEQELPGMIAKVRPRAGRCLAPA